MAEEPFVVAPERERCVLVGVDLGPGEWTVDESLDELERLAWTDGADTVGRVTQRLDRPFAKTFLGSGKLSELKEMAETLKADVVIFDDELTPSQQSNIERAVGLDFKVIDRTALILDIFGQHAQTREGKLQVQMAQLKYLYPRLRGMWAHLAKDKTRGGIGSRFGQGESQLEVDRRLIRNRMSTLRRELAKVESNREVQHKQRYESQMFRVALAGYTNAGKSTLLNKLTDAQVLTQDLLFATLDPTTRLLGLPGGRQAVLTDTVGFIQKLPTGLVEAFKSTLAEVKGADLILKIADASDPHVSQQLGAVDDVLEEIGASSIAQLVVYNKIDCLEDEDLQALRHRHPDAATVSALAGDGLESLVEAISRIARSRDTTLQVLIPYDRGDLVKRCHEQGTILTQSFDQSGTRMTVIAPPLLAARLEPFQERGDRPDRPAADDLHGSDQTDDPA